MSRHVPDVMGSAGGRALIALVDGLIGEGHEVRVWSWGPVPPSGPLPEWCEWRALPPESGWRTRGRALARPRWDAARLQLPIADYDLAVADTPVSYAAVAAHPRSVVTVHHSAWLDLRAVGPRSAPRLQDLRTERRAVHGAALTVAYSPRVARAVDRSVALAPIAYPVPDAPLEPSTEPAAACVADWAWPANAAALKVLLQMWPLVRDRVPAASLLLAGAGLPAGSPGPGITAAGPVTSSADILARARLVVFPCPPTSGPKVKVLEALASGRAVVTTAAGAEGLWLDSGGGVVIERPEPAALAGAVSRLLVDPERCSALGLEGRTSIVAVHAPRPAAQARVQAWSRLA